MEHLTAAIGSLTGSIVRQVTEFAPWLRDHGFRAGVPETLTAIAALTELNLTSIDEVCFAFRSIYARTPAEWGIFPTLFEQYFGIREARLQEKRRLQSDDLLGGTVAGEKAERPTLETVQGILAGFHSSDGERFALRADGQVLKDVVKLTQLAVRTMDAPRGRKWQSRGREKMDLRRTIRSALRHSGEPFKFKMRRRRPDKPRIVLVIDISGSMKPYAPFITSLAWSFTRVRARTQIFLFSTRLLRVTSLIARKGVEGIPYGDLPGLRGGTQIGGALAQLLHRYPSLLQRHTCVIIMSDGFDAGNPEQMHTSMRDLAARVGRVVWMNPLLGEPGYEPTSVGMSMALPYIDAFVNVHDVATWKKAVLSGALRAAAP
ncbi:vWA domain-containing protein [Bacillus methanolicus]|uniref:VWA containing CoxE family protein n=1 Tax=Bacillus methanolicus (strain MGA3 / ATCC 53907) TaxID=796606 RepID=I3E8H0_BACMM|nr:VWA domain-containing protein [Bacillus methanolicus]AIE60063.1 VWA containing CoxE family protein [Bacillus methanolicus MGA3]EIJ82791.1 VWA containing CoxE family protein [Bacillus methanolicus MGA3]